MLQIKHLLNSIVDNAYSGSKKIEDYKKFYVTMIDKDYKSKHGDYERKTHKIRVFNLYRDDNLIIVTTIHELAHHIDTVNRSMSNHDDQFYKVYKTLLYTSLDMGIFSKEEFKKAVSDSSDRNKVVKMIAGYKPHDIGFKKGIKKVICHNAYYERNTLKDRGFTYNSVNRTWEKEVPEEELEEITEMIEDLELKYEVTDANRYTFNR